MARRSTRARDVATAARQLGLEGELRERVVERYASGAPSRVELLSGRARVGVVLLEEDGRPSWAWSMRRGKKHGLELEWHENGRLAFEEPYVNGRAHGTARQWDDRGRLLVTYTIERGSGLELWCDPSTGALSEETHLIDGRLHGPRRWWNGDDRTVYAEEHFLAGVPHGIERRWDGAGRVRRRFFVNGERVPAREYARRVAEDPTLDRKSVV